MKDFINSTTAGNEKALRRGKVVPPDAVNIAWAKSPKLTPDKNVSIVDFSQLIPENYDNSDQQTRCRVMYANHAGILVDDNGSEIVRDEFPAVTDVFTIDEDYSVLPTTDSEYKARHILPFLHISRYFHVDVAGLAAPSTMFEADASAMLKVVKENGGEYVNEFGERAYRIQLAQAYIPAGAGGPAFQERGLYRVHVYVDTEDAEGLYLQYYKAEYREEDNNIVNLNISYREQLNPVQFYNYVPEESELADFNFNRFRQYSTKPAGGKEQVIGGGSIPAINGYKVYVPKKAIPDPRIFQLFRWRVRCEFTDTYGGGQIEPEEERYIRCGVLYDSEAWDSKAQLFFHNMEDSSINKHGLTFINPLGDIYSTNAGKSNPGYWKVDLNTVTTDELAQYDMLLYAPEATVVDFDKHYGKLSNYVFSNGGTVLVDSGNDTHIQNSGFEMMSRAIRSNGGFYDEAYPGDDNYSLGEEMVFPAGAAAHQLFKGEIELAGYDLSSVTPDKFSMRTQGYYRTKKTQVFSADASTNLTWDALIQTPDATALAETEDPLETVLAIAERRAYDPVKGAFIFTTLGFTSDVSRYFDADGTIVYDDNVLREDMPQYEFLANIYKLSYNICLRALANMPTSTLNSSATLSGLMRTSEGVFSTRWSAYTDWRPSWVIDGTVLTENERTKYNFTQASVEEDSSVVKWQRRLSDLNLKQLIDLKIGNDRVERMKSAERRYFLEFSNSAVEAPQIETSHNTIPTAFTTAYSPPFVVPLNLGPHVMKGEEIEGLYAEDSAETITYPPRSYRHYVKGTVLTTTTGVGPQTANISINGTATITTPTEPTYTVQPVVIPGETIETIKKLNWATHGSKVDSQQPWYPHYNMYYPDGIHTFQYSNFNNLGTAWGNSSLNWITCGILGHADAQTGGGEPVAVKFIQKAMNKFKFFNLFPASIYLTEDGVYGAKTVQVVKEFQTYFRQMDRSGYVNAETWGTMASQIIRIRDFVDMSHTDIYKDPEAFFREAVLLSQLKNISDGSPHTAYVKRSNSRGGTIPPAIWDVLGVRLSQKYDIVGVGVTPYTMTKGPGTIIWNSIHVTSTTSGADLRTKLTNYNVTSGQFAHMNRRPKVDIEDKVNFQAVNGNTVLIQIGQDQNSGWYDTKIMGIRDISIYAKFTSSTAPQTYSVPSSGLMGTAGTGESLRTSTSGSTCEYEWKKSYLHDHNAASHVPPSTSVRWKGATAGEYSGSAWHEYTMWTTSQTVPPQWPSEITTSHGHDYDLPSDGKIDQTHTHRLVKSNRGGEPVAGVLTGRTRNCTAAPQPPQSTQTVPFTINKTVTLEPGDSTSLSPHVSEISVPGGATISSVRYDSVTSDNPYIEVNLSTSTSSGTSPTYTTEYEWKQSYIHDWAQLHGTDYHMGDWHGGVDAWVFEYAWSTSNTVKPYFPDTKSHYHYHNDARADEIPRQGDPVVWHTHSYARSNKAGDHGLTGQTRTRQTSGGTPGTSTAVITATNVGAGPTAETNHKIGPVFPDHYQGDLNNDGTLDYSYSMDKLGNASPAPEAGTIKRSDGIKLFCNIQKAPNWDTLPPPGAAWTQGANSGSSEYVEYTIVPVDNDAFVTVGFYDITAQEFIFDAQGVSRISADELARRGSHNIYVAALTEYQKIEETPIPPAASTDLPYLWAMPVYGVCERIVSRIGIEPLNPGLDKFDVWPVAIRTGKFAKDVYVRRGAEGGLTGWVADYRGKYLRAVYSIPEANRSGWSPILGRPYVDISDETPKILDKNLIQIRQAPIALRQEPTTFYGPYDPARPFFTVYVRESGADPWRQLDWSEILDYKVASGKIYLKEPIPGGVTAENVKVSYSTKTDLYPFKFSEGQRINLNPHSSITESYINKALYIYMVPSMVLDTDGNIIPASVTDTTLRFTTDSSIFLPTHPEYNPLIVRLGVVYVNNGSDIRNLILLDTRLRGGGLLHEVSDKDAETRFPETSNFWDIVSTSGDTYQNGGFMIIRLPEELKDQFPTEDASEKIRSIIDSKVPAGVAYKLEYLDGTPWED